MLNNLSLRAKLLGLAIVATAALVITVITGSSGIRSGILGVEALGHIRLPAVQALQQIREIQIALLSSTYEVALWENDADAADQFAQIGRDKEQLWQKIDPIWQRYESLPKSDEESRLWPTFVDQWGKFKKDDEALIALVKTLADNNVPAKQKEIFQQYFGLGGQERMSYLAALKALDLVMASNTLLVVEATDKAVQATVHARQWMLWIGGAAILLVVLLSLIITSGILRQMGCDPREAVAITRRIAEGDLTFHIPCTPKDKDSLLASIAYMQQHLRALIGEVTQSADNLFRSSASLGNNVDQVTSNGSHEENASNSQFKI